MADLIPSICPYCATGCGFYIAVEGGKPVGIEFMKDHPVCEGSLCPKGNAALEIIDHEDRLRYPLKREGDGWVRISWDEALDLVAGGLKKALEEHGPEALGFLGSSKCTNETNFLFQKMARMLGTNNIDSCARFCHSPTIVALTRAFGSGVMTNHITDLRNSDCIFIIGSNFAETHPPIARWVFRAKERGATVIVVDPRRTPTSWLADIFLQIKPGTDLALLNGMMKVIVDEGLIDSDFINDRTFGFRDLEIAQKDLSLEKISEITGVSLGQILKAARTYATASSSAIVYSMGITQHNFGTRNVTSCANLALICGQIGRPGTGILSLRGQNNVQGACDMGILPDYYPGHLYSEDPGVVETFSKAWKVESLPAKPGLTTLEMMQAAKKGDIKAMYIMGEDPVNSDPNTKHTEDALDSLDFLVVQDIFLTDTAKKADVVLPAAVWAEKEGSFTSTERRVQWSKRALDPPDEAKDDMWIINQVAERMGHDFGYEDAAEVLREINSLLLNYGGATPERLVDNMRGLCLPCLHVDHPGTRILHVDEFSTADGKGKIVPVSFAESVEKTSTEYPLVLTTGREVLHYNAGSMTRRSSSLIGRAPEIFVEMNRSDADDLGIDEGDRVLVKTKRGQVNAKARLTGKLDKGVVFVPFHYPGANKLTKGALDPEAKIPEFKVAACNVSREGQ
jgi:formate dehydrogenase alpha subunit